MKLKTLLLCAVICLFCTACGTHATSDSLDSNMSSSEIATEDSSNEDNTSLNLLEETKLPKATKIEVSGNKEDVIVVDSDCYIEGDKVIIYLQKGLSVPGDVLKVTEEIMADLEAASGFTFDKNYAHDTTLCHDLYYEPGIFEGINEDNAKINVLVVSLTDNYVQWASDNNAIIDITDYDYDYMFYQTLYHELAHVLQARNGVGLSPTLNEGYATYLASKTIQAKGTPDWNTMQYFGENAEVEALISEGESAFSAELEGRNAPYQYGFRFLQFITAAYGEDAFRRILDEATRQNYNAGYDESNYEASIKEDTDQLISIFKSLFSENIFEEFKTWYFQEYSQIQADYYQYMTAFGW